MENNDYSNVKSDYDDHNYTYYGHNYTYFDYNYTNYHNNYWSSDFNFAKHIMNLVTCVIISFGLPLTLAAIYSLYSQVQNNNVAPIYIINLLISDLIQLCYMIFLVAKREDGEINGIFPYIYDFSVMASVGFMVCIALERYLVIAWPLWYHVRSTIKISLLVCVVVWTLPLLYVLPVYFWVKSKVTETIFAFFLLVPFPLFIFFLGGTLKSLSAAILVSSDEKRRIVGMLFLVLLIYTLLFLPNIIWYLAEEASYNDTFSNLSVMLLRSSPLADLMFRKEAIDKFLAFLCCCRKDSDDNSRSSSSTRAL